MGAYKNNMLTIGGMELVVTLCSNAAMQTCQMEQSQQQSKVRGRASTGFQRLFSLCAFSRVGKHDMVTVANDLTQLKCENPTHETHQ